MTCASTYGGFALCLGSKSRQSTKDSRNDAKSIFLACGYLASNIPIPKGIFVNLVGDTEAADDAIEQLLELGLLTYSLIIHPLLTEFARSLARNRKILKSLVLVIEGLSAEANETDSLSGFALLRPHIEAIAPIAESANLEKASENWSNLGRYYLTTADYNKAKSAYERALASDKKAHDDDFPNKALYLAQIANLMKDLGDYDDAISKMEAALQMVVCQELCKNSDGLGADAGTEMFLRWRLRTTA